MGESMGSEVVTKRGSSDGFSGGDSDGKLEGSLMGDTQETVVGY